MNVFFNLIKASGRNIEQRVNLKKSILRLSVMDHHLYMIEND